MLTSPAMERAKTTRLMNLIVLPFSLEVAMVGLPRIELGTSSLSGMRSNQLSYSPAEHLSYRVAKPIGDRPDPKLAGQSPVGIPVRDRRAARPLLPRAR